MQQADKTTTTNPSALATGNIVSNSPRQSGGKCGQSAAQVTRRGTLTALIAAPMVACLGSLPAQAAPVEDPFTRSYYADAGFWHARAAWEAAEAEWDAVECHTLDEEFARDASFGVAAHDRWEEMMLIPVTTLLALEAKVIAAGDSWTEFAMGMIKRDVTLMTAIEHRR